MLHVTVDSSQVKAGITRFAGVAMVADKYSKMDVGEELMRLSSFEVPHDTGYLQNSGDVELRSNGDVVVGYHTVYAARLHEHPEYNFQKGRKGKYLEDPARRNQAVLGFTYAKGFGGRAGTK